MTVGFKTDTSGYVRTEGKPNEIRTMKMEISSKFDDVQEIEF